MNKSEPSSQLARRANLPRTVADRTVGALISAISDALAAGDTVAIAGFGTFATRQRPARQGRNPATGEAIAIAGVHGTNLQARQDPSPGRQCANRVNAPSQTEGSSRRGASILPGTTPATTMRLSAPQQRRDRFPCAGVMALLGFPRHGR